MILLISLLSGKLNGQNPASNCSDEWNVGLPIK
jgi:hypothetical protein